MARRLYASITNCSNVTSINVQDSHGAQLGVAMFECESTSLDIGSAVSIDAGYADHHHNIFNGYVKNIEVKEPEKTYSITCSNYLVRAVDFFIASSTPDNPFKRKNIKAEDLVHDVLDLAGITNYQGDNTMFTFAVYNTLEVNLTAAYDYCKFIADILAWHLYADENGKVWFVDRKPYVMGGDTSIGTINGDSLTSNEIIEIRHSKSDRDLRNKVIVYGTGSIHGEASASSPYLPAGFYKTVVVAAPGVIDTQDMAQDSADYNLVLLNRLTESIALTVAGNPDYLARRVVTLVRTNLGLTSANWYIYSAEHAWGREGYSTTLELRK